MNAIEAHIDSATIQAIAQLIVERFDPEPRPGFGRQRAQRRWRRGGG